MVKYTPEEIIAQEKQTLKNIEKLQFAYKADKLDALQYHSDIIYYLEFAIKHANW